jgi:hypothetical protein
MLAILITFWANTPPALASMAVAAITFRTVRFVMVSPLGG